MGVELEYVLEIVFPDMCQCGNLHPRVSAVGYGTVFLQLIKESDSNLSNVVQLVVFQPSWRVAAI